MGVFFGLTPAFIQRNVPLNHWLRARDLKIHFCKIALAWKMLTLTKGKILINTTKNTLGKKYQWMFYSLVYFIYLFLYIFLFILDHFKLTKLSVLVFWPNNWFQ